MPSVSQSPTGTTSQGSIILIEEYDALAAAISSALRRFAANHATHIAGSLAEAKTLARKIDPALFVIDFDPAFPGLTAFLQKMQELHPSAKALIIAGKVPREIAVEARTVGALQFVDKPFDVPEFGAAVQALLGPWTEPETATPRATLESLSLPDILLAQCAGARTVALEIKNGSGKSGEILLRGGRLSHAEAGKKTGPDAVRQMLAWRDIEVREREKPRLAGGSIEEGSSNLLIEAFREIKASRPKPPERTTPPKARVKTGKKIVVVDDTEMLLIFVEDVLMTADPELQITTALNGISGIKEIERLNPDLVLLDYSLPDINGDEVCRRLLQNDATARIPVLMMSGHVPEMSKAAATLDNVIATMPKPFLSDALINVVQQTLKEPPPLRRKAVPPKSRVSQPPPAPPKPPAVPPVSTEQVPRPVPAPQKPIAAPLSPFPSPVIEPPPKQVSQPAPAPELPNELLSQGKTSAPEKSPAIEAGEAVEVPPPPLTAAKPVPKIAAKPPRQLPSEPVAAARPEPAPISPRIEETKRPQKSPEQIRSPEPAAIAVPIIPIGASDVVLGLFLDVVSVQLTPELRMGSIRARPSSREVSLHIASAAMRAALPETGFQLGTIGLDDKGRIATMRLIPTRQPFKAAQTRNALEIGGITVVPMDSTKRVQLTPTADCRMTMHLLAQLELAGVELSSTFQISQLVLKTRNNTVRVTLNPQSSGQESSGTKCETLAVHLDHSAQITELLLNPIR